MGATQAGKLSSQPHWAELTCSILSLLGQSPSKEAWFMGPWLEGRPMVCW